MLSLQQKYELHAFNKSQGKCVKILDIPVTINANMSANLGRKQKYELHAFNKSPGKCVKIRDILVTIDANVREFGTPMMYLTEI
jgi:hypothetical protein